MKILVSDSWLEAIKPLLKEDEAEEAGIFYRRFSSNSASQSKLDISDLSDVSLQRLFAFLGQRADEGNRSARMSQNIITQWMQIKTNPDGSVVGKLENIPSAMKTYIGAVPNRYIFEQSGDGNLVPWFVSSIRYHEAREGSPAYVNVDLLSINASRSRRSRDEGRCGDTFTIHASDIRKRTMSQILEAKGYFRETSARMESYLQEVERYREFCDNDGLQMSVLGKAATDLGGWYANTFRAVGQNGRPAKMVVDPPEDGRVRSSELSAAPFWSKEETLYKIPTHPILDMFDLESHTQYRVHINAVTPYVYDDTVDAKLVLPHDIKDFLAVLIEHSKNTFEDIVGGKEGGTIVLIDGLPGIGKTLTAEVYSEKMHRPLYKVQSSQLGIDVDTVEKNLKEVLRRAERWGAILLLDEADVYVHERGTDITQNAIVGVFLRVLEYYRGVLFATTNRGVSIDDAIISRASACFHYEMPSPDEQRLLWHILSQQNKIELTTSEIAEIVEFNNKLSGRDIKNLLKLAMVAATNKGGKVTPALIAFVSRFRQNSFK